MFSIFLETKLLENFILGIFEYIILFKSINFQSSSFFEGKPFLLKSNSKSFLSSICLLLRFKISFNNKLKNNKDRLNSLIRLLGKPDQIFGNNTQKLDFTYKDIENLFKNIFMYKKNQIIGHNKEKFQ